MCKNNNDMGSVFFLVNVHRKHKRFRRAYILLEKFEKFLKTVKFDRKVYDEENPFFVRINEYKNQIDTIFNHDISSKYQNGLRNNIDTIHSEGNLDIDSMSRIKFFAKEMDIFPRKIDSSIIFREFIRRHFIDPGKFKLRLEIGGNIITFGSCFAQNIRKALIEKEVTAENIEIPEGMNTSFAVSEYINFLLKNDHEKNNELDTGFLGGGIQVIDTEKASKAYNFLKTAECVIITYGLSEIWEDKKTQSVLWGGVPAELYDKKRYIFRQSSVEENVLNIEKTFDDLKKLNHKIKIVFTVSPIPMAATFSSEKCMVADSRSKAVLRCSVEKALSSIKSSDAFYWPSYEMFRGSGPHVSYPTINFRDSRHIDPNLIKEVTDYFIDVVYG